MLKLPLGWEVRHESGYTWYQNLFTKESTWEPPPGSILPPVQPSPLVADYGDYEEPPHAAPAASAPVVPVDPAPAAEFVIPPAPLRPPRGRRREGEGEGEAASGEQEMAVTSGTR